MIDSTKLGINNYIKNKQKLNILKRLYELKLVAV